ncbi:MAG TPA: methyltransferase domain-containing protein [Vicinamibacterales bacterium]|jgi:SAM-dependent methyltransferase|nr:methyltransferase domain-containing protein [Vicinamibacterales bacterium]
MDLDSIYAAHPLRAATILQRLERDGQALSTVTELQLAIDLETELTDQNHSGGVESVRELAHAAGVTPSSVVLDVGCGLGGSARVLAAEFGCHVIGIERDAARCNDARQLTALVGLDHLVTIRHQDALAGDIMVGDVDVLWGQGAWIHFDSPGDFLARWIPALRRGGHVAAGDAFLMREAAAGEEEALVAGLESSWAAHLTPLDEWGRELERQGCRIIYKRDVTGRAIHDFKRLMSVCSRWPQGIVSTAEKRSWQRAVAAFERGLVGSFQIVAVRLAV